MNGLIKKSIMYKTLSAYEVSLKLYFVFFIYLFFILFYLNGLWLLHLLALSNLSNSTFIYFNTNKVLKNYNYINPVEEFIVNYQKKALLNF